MIKKRLLLFDLDGTLVRTNGAGNRAMNRGFQVVMGWINALSEISPAGMTDPLIAQQVAQKKRGFDLQPQEMAAIFQKYLDYLKEELACNSEYRILPGIQIFLEKTFQRRHIWLGLGTGNLEAGARLKLEPGNLNHYFPFGGFGSDAWERPDVLRIAVQRAEAFSGQRFAPGEVWVIGDTAHDIHAGQAIGARTLAVATGPFSTGELVQHTPDMVIENFNELDAVERIFS